MKHSKNTIRSVGLFLLLIFFNACDSSSQNGNNNSGDEDFAELPSEREIDGLKIATFAGGCFWCTEAVFERVKGVKEVISGYAGGTEENPTYDQVSQGKTSHAESIQVYYDPDDVDYGTLLDVFFLGAHDPTQVNRQGPDVGTQYRSIAFYRNMPEKKMIEEKIQKLNESNEFSEPIATQIKEFKVFYPAEKYHQDYYPANQDSRYIQSVSKPKVEKFEKRFPNLLKEEFSEG